MTHPREVELKFDVDPADTVTLRTHLRARLGPPTASAVLVSVYFDSAAQVLRQHGIALRVRTTEGRHIQTVKAADGVAGGLFARDEWETTVADAAPDLAAVNETPAGALLDGAPLLALFETRIDRTTWLVERHGGRVEVSFDEGRIVAGRRSAPIHELELESKGGTPRALFGLLRDIAEGAALRIGVRAKSEQGYALLRKPPRAFKAEPVALHLEMTAAAAFQAVLRSCIRHFRLNEPLVDPEDGPRPLHQARVGLRRLRSALSLFGPMVNDRKLKRLKARLRTASRLLGDARDLDVSLARADASEAARAPDGSTYLDALRTRRVAAYARMTEMLASASFRRLMLDLMVWVEDGPWLRADDPRRRRARERPVAAEAADILDKRRRAVKRRGRHLAALDPEARHQLRIAAKKLRYAADFVAALPAGEERDRHAAFVGALKGLQAVLGELNDIHTGYALAIDIARHAQGASALPLAAGHVDGPDDARVAPLLGKAVEAYAAFRAAAPFWTPWRAP